jgi:hypothetical protein
LIDISDSKSAESQSVISGERVKSLAMAFTPDVAVVEVAMGNEVDGCW